ncbi:hypothetical protein H5410_037133 [Solanum commersonii]|uniref:Uncharacterized protein n=1 Tax=Solanum commersonii TaxID=4109 RepID=A0A9J5Y6W7_SOLCO|nr:hypothetical protein H5410_037133 [Solanum commersonii]
MAYYMPNMLEVQKKKKEEAKRNKKSSGEDQGDSSKKILPNKRKQKIIYGEFENLGEDNPLDNSSVTLIDNNIDNTNNMDFQELESEKFKQYSESNRRRDLKDSFEDELPDQQQEENINGESDLNKITCEDGIPDNSDRIINDNIINYGSRLLAKDENDGNYHITQGIPRSTKFRYIDNFYKAYVYLLL